jgi:hypothetical protein
MADEENPLEFSVKEIKEITTEANDASGVDPDRAPIKNRRSFIQDSASLLADVRGSIDEEAAVEAASLADKDRERQELKRRQEQKDFEAHEAEVQSQIAAEEVRKKAVTVELDRIRMEQIRADEPEEPTQAEEEVAPPAEQPERFEVQTASTPTPPPTRGSGFYIAAVGLPILGLVVITFLLWDSPKPEPTPTPTVKELSVGSTIPAAAKGVDPNAPPATKLEKPGTPPPETVGTNEKEASGSGKTGGDSTGTAETRTPAKPPKKARSRKGRKRPRVTKKGSGTQAVIGAKKKKKKKKKDKKVKKKFNIKLGGDGLSF